MKSAMKGNQKDTREKSRLLHEEKKEGEECSSREEKFGKDGFKFIGKWMANMKR